MNKIILSIIIGVFLISMVSSTTYLQSENLDLKIATNETSCNLTVAKPNSNIIIDNQVMTVGVGYANYTISGSSLIDIGEYQYFSDCGSSYFEITPSGFSTTSTFYLILLLIVSLVVALGFWIKEVWFVVIGGMAIMILGVYSLINGIAGFRDDFITTAISLFEIGIGAILSIGAAMQKIDL